MYDVTSVSNSFSAASEDFISWRRVAADRRCIGVKCSVDRPAWDLISAAVNACRFDMLYKSLLLLLLAPTCT